MTLNDLQGHSLLQVFQMWFFRIQLCGDWQDFNWHSASRGFSAVAELPVACAVCSVVVDGRGRSGGRYELVESRTQSQDGRQFQRAAQFHRLSADKRSLQGRRPVMSLSLACSTPVLVQQHRSLDRVLKFLANSNSQNVGPNNGS